MSSHQNLITPLEAITGGMNSTTLKASSPGVDLAIEDITREVEAECGRGDDGKGFICRKYRLVLNPAKWTSKEGYFNTTTLTLLHLYPVPTWVKPVVQVISIVNATLTDVSWIGYTDGYLTFDMEHADAPASMPTNIDLFAGYAREDQTFAILVAADTDLAGLNVEPQKLPKLVRGVSIELTLHRLFQGQSKGFGTGKKISQGGAVPSVIESSDLGFIERNLGRLTPYKSYYA